MKTKLCDVNPVAKDKLPHLTDDKSGVGVHYVDAFLKPMNVKLPDGTAVRCKRRGLKITLTAGTKKGGGSPAPNPKCPGRTRHPRRRIEGTRASRGFLKCGVEHGGYVRAI